MIKEKDLQEAIAECQGVKNPNASTCMKLAAYYTIQDHLQKPEYSLAPRKEYYAEEVVGDYGDSDFFHLISGMDAAKAWAVMGDIMDALYVLNPKLYNLAISKLG